MFLLIKNAELYAPRRSGRRDLLIAAGTILAVGEGIDASGLPGPVEVLDARGGVVAPGFVDCHVHVTGGGGEGGFSTRTPELGLGDATGAGVTTVVGVLGTDGVARSMEALVAKTYALREEGISAWCYTGSYRVPVRTLTGDAVKDIMMIEPILGIGEVAVSDHRSSRPTVEELARVAAEARIGGMLSGKAGLVNVHMGDAPAGFGPLAEVVAAGDIPREQFLPTHCGRNTRLMEEALSWAKAGGRVDFTAGSARGPVEDGECSPARALARMRSEGLSLDLVTWSSDGQGSLPRFDSSGRLVGLAVGSCSSLAAALREAVLELGIPLDEALRPLTLNPAQALGLAAKGRIEEGADADLVILDEELRPRTVVAKGRIHVREGEFLVSGAFEPDGRSGMAGAMA